MKRVQRLSRHNRIKQSRAWLMLGWVTAERSCPCKQLACPTIGGGSEVTFKPWVPSRLSVRKGFLALTSPGQTQPRPKTADTTGCGTKEAHVQEFMALFLLQ
ncbi:hypothetical protein J6590_088791 [Homalodisca vitripennis]|nr:hypothetical protein J6590_088791 [Homalodisca vitripennis]